MRLFHGVNINEVATRLLPPREISAAIPFVVGVAPIHLSGSDYADVLNKPVLVNTYEEYIEVFGKSAAWDKYTLSEFAYTFFGLYGVGPAIFLNVMNPAATTGHGTAVTAQAITLAGGAYTLVEDADISSLVVKSSDAVTTHALTTDYTAAYDANGHIVITRVTGGGILTDTTALKLDYTKIGASPCDGDDVIAGLAFIEDVYAIHSVVPGMIVAPGFSHLPAVAAEMETRCTGINSLFSAICIVDIDSTVTGADAYTEANTQKTTNSLTSPQMIVCWPKVKLGTVEYWMSSHVAGRIAATDADNDDVPYVSPSNKEMQINGLVVDAGTDVILTIPKADTLNGQGITTGLNFNGWKCWGNRTGAYPGSTDPKDVFASIRRMFNWVGNNAVLLLWQKLDDPINRRTIETAIDSVNQWLNGLVSKGAFLAGRMEFLQAENTNADLASGKVTFHLYLTPPAPAEQINVTLEYDVTGNSAIFS
ncbi:MAG: phage tail sheath family protein [Armatimonadota bacterium]